MTFKSHLSQCHPALDSPDFSIRDRKSRIRLFSEKIVEMISKFDQGYLWWRNSICRVSLFNI